MGSQFIDTDGLVKDLVVLSGRKVTVIRESYTLTSVAAGGTLDSNIFDLSCDVISVSTLLQTSHQYKVDLLYYSSNSQTLSVNENLIANASQGNKVAHKGGVAFPKALVRYTNNDLNPQNASILVYTKS